MDTETGSTTNSPTRTAGLATLAGTAAAGVMLAIGLAADSGGVVLFAPLVGLFVLGLVLAGT